jgi:hypothetical protein
VAVVAVGWAVATMGPAAPARLSDAEKVSLARQFAAARMVTPVEQFELTARYDRERAEAVTRCMRLSRWPYVAYVPDAPQPPGFGLGPQEYARQYGFGISTTVDRLGDVVPDDDPNVEIRNRLSEEELAGYRLAHRRCTGEANRAIPLPPGTMVTSKAGTAALKEVQRQVDADPRITAATAEWSRCMVAAGFTADRPEGLRDGIRERLAPLSALLESPVAAESRPVTRDGTTAGRALDDVHQRRLAQLQSYERGAATADWRCGATLRPLTEKIYAERVDQLLGAG